MSAVAPVVDYVGQFDHRLDARNRVTVPSSWRVLGDEGNYYFAWAHPEGCIAIYPPALMAELSAKAHEAKLSDLRANRLRRAVFGSGSTFGCDKQGRILLPRNLMDYAKIDKSVVLVGVGRSFEVWSSERYAASADESFDMLTAMQELGL